MKEMKKNEKIIFALGDIFGGGAQSLVSVLYLIFLTDIIHLNIAIAATIVMISKVWDAVTDPLMGIISDNTRTRIGRRRPYIMLGGFLIIITFALMWLPVGGWESNVAKITYILATFLLYSTVSTIIAVPYNSYSAEITTDIKERNGVNVLRLVVSTLSTALCTLVPSEILDMYKAGDLGLSEFYIIIGIGFGIIYALPLILIGLFTKERTPIPEGKSVFQVSTFIKPLRVKAFRGLVFMYLAQSIAMDILAAGIVYYSLYVSGGSTTIFLGSFILVQLLMFPIINKLVNTVDKRRIYYFGLPLAIVAFIGVGLYPSSWPIEGVYLLNGLTALGFAGASMMSWIIFPDAIDVGDLQFNERATGSYSGIMTFIRKSSSAFAIFVFGIMLNLFGFVNPTEEILIPAQPDSALFGIRVAMVGTSVLLMLFGYWVARNFVLTNDRSKKVREFLKIRDEKGSFDHLDRQLKADLSQIQEELF